jgi:ABC-type branched-subunit amino acid transport system substrate-binding protein
MSRRILLALLALVMAAALAAAGCGGGEDDDDDGGGEAGAPAETAGFDGKTIKLGVVTPLSGPVAVIGNPLTAGNQVWIDYVNSQGGVAGKYKVELVQRDSRYEAPVAAQAYNGLKDDVVAFVQILGTPIISALLPQLKKDQTAAGPATLDSAWVHEPNLIPNGAPYQIQAINAMDYYLRTEGKEGNPVICTMIQDDPYGEAGQSGIDFAAEQLDFEVAETARYKTGDKDFTGQIQQLSGAKCDMVFLVGVPSDVGGILGTAAQAKFNPRWIGQSPTWVGALAESPLKEYLEARYWLVAEGPEWGDESVPGMRDLLDRKQQFRPKTAVEDGDIYFTFGYNEARAVTTVLEQAVENGDLSREGVLQAIEDVDTVEFDGLGEDYTYGPIDDRSPGRQSSIFEIDASRPFGLKALETNFSSDAAEAYEFPTG